MSLSTSYIPTTEDEELQRLETAYCQLLNHWSNTKEHLHKTEECHDNLQRGYWDYLAYCRSVFDAGRVQEAEQRCHKLHNVSWPWRPLFCRADALELAASCCMRDHDSAIAYLHKATCFCADEIERALFEEETEDKESIRAGDERLRRIWSEIARRETERLVEEERLAGEERLVEAERLAEEVEE